MSRWLRSVTIWSAIATRPTRVGTIRRGPVPTYILFDMLIVCLHAMLMKRPPDRRSSAAWRLEKSFTETELCA